MTLKKIFRSRHTPLFAAGFMFWIIAAIVYFFIGFIPLMFSFWISSLIVIGFFFSRQQTLTEEEIPFVRKDLYALLSLLLIFAPTYLLLSYNIPWRVDTDEIAVMAVSQELTSKLMDPFGESYYYGFPRFAFILLGTIAKFFGGEASLTTARNAHGFLGLLTVLFSFLLFRQMLSRGAAFCASVLLGFNHAFLAISRMGIWTHTAVVIELPALAILFWGFRRRSLFLSFLGGAIGGLSCYVYFAGRATVVVWFIFLVLTPLILHKKISFPLACKLGGVSLVGCLLVATPMLIATAKKNSVSMKYMRQQILLFPEARQMELKWLGTKTVAEAIRKNFSRGLSSFNGKYGDHGVVYPHPGHGFVDPLTGGLIWLGLAIILIKFIFRLKINEGDLFSLTGFFFIWLFMSLLVTRAPNYTRLMVALPFIVYFCITAIKTISRLFCSLLSERMPKLTWIGDASLTVFSILIIIFWNLMIYGDFVKAGYAKGDAVGGTYRYMETKKEIPNYNFYLSASDEYPYYYWGEKSYWEYWMEHSIRVDHKFKFFEPEQLTSSLPSLERPFTLFVAGTLWDKIKEEIEKLYQPFNIKKIQPDGSRLAIEVL